MKFDPEDGDLRPGEEYEPDYLCWHERDFMGDRVVVRMSPLQRLMYRALLQAAPYCSTRPYLPDDADELVYLADAPDLDAWRSNSAAILKKFYRVEFEGVGYWAHKRILADYRQMIEADAKRKREWEAKKEARSASASKAGNKRWEKERAKPSDSDAAGSDSHDSMRDDASNKPETNSQAEKKPERESKRQSTETETNMVSVSVSGHADKGSISSVTNPLSESASGSGSVEIEASVCLNLWLKTRNEDEVTAADYDEQPIIRLLHDGVAAAEIKRVLHWLPKSDYWGKPGKGQLKGTAGFRSAYKAILRSYENYRESVLTSKRDKPRAAGSTPDGDYP